MLKAILNYQETDKKLYAIEKEIAESEANKLYRKLRTFLKTAPEKVDALDAKANSLRAMSQELMQKYEQLELLLADFANIEELIAGGADISFYKKKAQSVAEQVKKLKADIRSLTENIQATDEEYKTLKKKVKAATKQYETAKEEYDKVKSAVEKERTEYKTQLEEQAKQIEESVLNRYLTKRKEGTPFPIVAQIVGERCPICGMELPVAARGNLSKGVECESCHRILFN